MKHCLRYLSWLICAAIVVVGWGGFAAPASAEDSVKAGESAMASLPQITLAEDETRTVALELDTMASDVVAVDLKLSWDPAVFQVDAVALGGLAQGWAMAHNLTVPGELRVAMSAMQAANGSGSLVVLTVTAIGQEGDSTVVTIEQCSLNDGQVPCSPSHGSVAIGDVPPVYQINLPLVVGWNLVALPGHPASPNIRDVLAPIEGQVEIALAYNPFDEGSPWQCYSPAAPDFANDFSQLQAGQGFWVKVDVDTILSVSLTHWEGSQSLAVGWNLVGSYGETAVAVQEALSGLDGQYDVVYGYDAASALSPWTSYCPAADAPENTLFEFEPGRGYWVLMTEAGVWQSPL